MSQQEMFQILGKQEWDNYENGEYEYGINYVSQSGVKHTFWITIKNEKIIATNSY